MEINYGDFYAPVENDVKEFYYNLNWFVIDKEEEEDCARSFLPDLEKYGVKNNIFSLIKKTTVPFCKEAISVQPPNNKEVKLQQNYIPGLDPKYEILYPERSNLTWKEQRLLFSILSRNKYKGFLSYEERTQFQELILKAQDDYAVFQDYVQSKWNKHHYVRVKEIPPQVSEYNEHYWNIRVRECRALYPDRYKSNGFIALALNDPNSDVAVLDHVKKVFNVGKPHTMFMPSFKKRYDLISDYSTLCKIKPIVPPLMSGTNTSTKKLLPVSLDPNMEKALETNNIDVVMTKSAVKTLCLGHTSHKEWILPITVKTVYNVDQVSKKVVIIDKRLPPSSMSVHDKNVWHAKLVSRWIPILLSNPNLFRDKTTGLDSAKGQNKLGLSDLTKQITNLDINTGSNTIEKSTGAQLVSAKKLQHEGNKSNEQKNLKTPIVFSQNPGTSTSSAKGQNELGLSDLTKQITNLDINTGSNTIRKSTGAQLVSAKKLQHEGNKSNEQTNLKTPIVFSQNPGTSTSSERTLTQYDNFTYEDVEEEFGVDQGNGGDKDKKDSKLGKSDTKLNSLLPEKEKDKVLTDKAVASSSGLTPKTHTINSLKQKSSSRTLPKNSVACKKRPEIVHRPYLAPRNREGCVEYNLWNLHKSKHFKMGKHEQRSLNILIRNKVDGILTHHRSGRFFKDVVCVSSKVEFQPEYGASKLAVNERLREYIDLYLNKEAMLFRIRSIGHTKELMLTELKSMRDIRDHFQVDKVSVRQLFDPLYAVLIQLVNLPVGKYMLQYNTKMGAFGQLLLGNKNGNNFNLTNYFRCLHEDGVSVAAAQIDPLTLTALHYHIKLPPALLKPSPNASFLCILGNAPLKRRKKKKKSNKKVACSSICASVPSTSLVEPAI